MLNPDTLNTFNENIFEDYIRILFLSLCVFVRNKKIKMSV